MPGVELNLPIPSLSDTQTQVVTKTAQALTLIDSDLAAKVLPSEIDINSALNFAGNPATNVGYITLGGGTPGVVIPGAMYYNNGEWFVVDSTGTIQLTAAGALNLSVNGGIGGDYIATAALLSFNSAGSKYIFLGAAAASIVDIDVRKVILEGTSATVTIGVDAALVSNKVINIKSLPTVGVGLLLYDSAAQAIIDGSTFAMTDTATFSGILNVTGALTTSGTTTFTTGFTGANKNVFTKETPFTLGPGSSNVSASTFDNVSSSADGAWTWRSEPFDLAVGDKITSALLRVTRNSATTAITANIKKRNVVTGTTTVIQSQAGGGIGTADLTVTVGAPVAIASRERWYFEITGTQTTGISDAIIGASVTWTT